MFKTILLSAVLFCHCAAAQPIDLRARSLRGAQAHPYGVAVRPAAPQPSVYRSPVYRSSAAQPEQTGTVADADGENGFQQTGLKIFKEEDEDKVLKLDVENPEFDRLSDAKKQSILNRITYKEN